ncbi:hypothetical protein L1987_62571 [Smallanthus sonchifolius]|uniref:Uncharacterized protein n=1 Tax=Smallanthus sonchifolius TaxID=185202 RepID=A0ACB9CAW7_9ASTR|nr:hypothetical protein L1987_62571 [Smallanthus sonchifolius]
MNWTPNPIFYACIAKDTTILAEFNSKDEHLSDLAKKCIEKTPAFHSVFSHTVHGKTYMFFIHDPFVYFGIFDESLEKHNCLLFLKSVKDEFTSMVGKMSPRFSSHCFQGEFSSVFHRLVASSSELDAVNCQREKPDVLSDDDVSSGSMLPRVRYDWNKQVMVVLSLDFMVCVGLFVTWLWVCNGFQCIAN